MAETADRYPHYYDMPQEFSVRVDVSGSITITVAAGSREDAEQAVEDMIDKALEAEDFDFFELEDVDDVRIAHAARNPTRMYLVSAPGRPSGMSISRPESHHIAREPTESDTERCRKLGYSMSWEAPQ